MSPIETIAVTAGSASANHGSFDTIGVFQSTVLTPTSWATTEADSDLDTDASWNTVSGPTAFSEPSGRVRSFLPKPFAYTVFPP